MHPSPALRGFLLDRAARSASAVAGLTIYGFGTYLQIQANIGLSPWNALNQGLCEPTGWSFGSISIFISFLIILLDLALREPIGLGTILDALVVGWSFDFFAWSGWVPVFSALPLQLTLLLLGLVIMFFGACLYMKAGLSCGPRDALLVALGRRLPRFSIGAINIALLAVVLLIAILLGELPGLGTAITIVGNGVIMDLVFRALRFEPRSVEHESLFQTWRALAAARGADAVSPPPPVK